MSGSKYQSLISDIRQAIDARRQDDGIWAFQKIDESFNGWPWGFFTSVSNQEIIVSLLAAIEAAGLSNTKLRFVALVAARRFEVAKEVYRQVEVADNDPYVGYLYAMACVSTNDPDTARETILRFVMSSQVGSFVFERLVDTYDMTCQGGEVSLAMAIADLYGDRYRESPMLCILSGIRHMSEGRRDLANEDWRVALAGPPVMLPKMRGIKTLAPLLTLQEIGEYDFGRWYGEVATHEFMDDFSVGPHESVMFCSCDENYFRLYGELWIAGVEVSNPGVNVHVNIIEASEETRFLARSLKGKFNKVALNFSFERTSIKTRTYYACSRFFLAPIMLDKYKRNLIITDVDIVVGGSATEIARKFPTHPVGMRKHIGWQLPWSTYIADFVCLGQSHTARNFIDLLNAYLARAFVEKGSDNWWVDQSALFAVVSQLLREDPNFKLFHPSAATKDLIYTGGVDSGGRLGWLAGTKLQRMQAALAHMTKERAASANASASSVPR